MLFTVRRLTASAGAAALVLVTACAGPGPTPTSTPTAPVTPAPTCRPDANRPPAASILDTKGEEIQGSLGGAVRFCAASDAPSPAESQLPNVQLTDDELNVVVSIADGPSFIGWSAYVTPQGDGPPGAIALAEGRNETGVHTVSFRGPTTGEWVISMTLTYPGEIGSATYFWRATVP